MQEKRSFTEHDLYKGVKEQDRRVLQFLYRKYSPMVRWMVINMGGSTEEAKDIFQDAIIELLIMSRKPGFKIVCKMKTLIYAIAKRQWKYKSRRRRKEIPLYLIEYEPQEEPPFPSQDEVYLYERIVWPSFQSLPETCRKVLLLSWEEYNVQEIATELNLTEGYIRKRKSTCMQRLIGVVRSHDEYELLLNSDKVLNLVAINHDR